MGRDSDILEKRREKGISLLQSGMSQSEVAMALNVSRQSVSRWVKAFKTFGDEGLKRKPKPGRLAKLGESQKQELIRLLRERAIQTEKSLWSSKDIAELIHNRFVIEFHKNHIPKLVRALANKMKNTRGM